LMENKSLGAEEKREGSTSRKLPKLDHSADGSWYFEKLQEEETVKKLATVLRKVLGKWKENWGFKYLPGRGYIQGLWKRN